MNDAIALSGSATFFWGVVGGLAAYIAVFVLPNLRQVLDSGVNHVNRVRLIGFLLVAIVYPMMGGIVALAIGDAMHEKHAIAYGVAWESILKAGTVAVQATVQYQPGHGTAP